MKKILLFLALLFLSSETLANDHSGRPYGGKLVIAAVIGICILLYKVIQYLFDSYVKSKSQKVRKNSRLENQDIPLNNTNKSLNTSRVNIKKKKAPDNLLIEFTKWIFKWLGIFALVFLVIFLLVMGISNYNQHQNLLKIEAKEFKEKAARGCLADQIPQAENSIKTFTNKIDPNEKLIDIRDKFIKETNYEPEIAVTKDNIKTKVLILTVGTSCESDFSFLININENENHELTKLYVYAQNPPEGYKTSNYGIIDSLTRDFEFIRNSKSLNKFDPDKFLSETQDHCAPNLSRQERLRRLATHGKVRESGLWTFTAGGSRIEFTDSTSSSVFTCY